MKFFLRVALGVACLTTAHAATLETTNIDGWLVGAYSDDRTGQFRHCASSTPYKSGITLVFAVGKDFTWSMGFANPQWQLRPGAEYDLIYWIDAGPKLTARGRANNKALVEVPLIDSRSLFESFRRGYQLSVQAAGETFLFNLNSSGKALAATLDCTKRYLARSTGTASNPFATPPPAPQGQVGMAESNARTEATILIANILSAAGIPGFRVVPREKIPDDFKSYDAVWTTDDVIGTVKIVSSQTVSSAEELATLVMASDAQTCKGVFASGRYPTQQKTGATRLRTGCSGSEHPIEVDYTIAPRAKGGFIVFGVLADEEKAQAGKEAGAKLHEAAVRTFARR
jgi:hypothetical protein